MTILEKESRLMPLRQVIIGLSIAGSLPLGSAFAESLTFQGTLGDSEIGMTIDVEDEKVGGPLWPPRHYFYQMYPTDIPLSGNISGVSTLVEPSGGVFTLRFLGNGSEKGQPLTLYNSLGFVGTWKKGDIVLPLKLGGRSGSSGDRLYGDVAGVGSSQAFEKKVQAFCKAVLADDRKLAAGLVSYPLTVNDGGKSRSIENEAALLQQWDTVFTPAWRKAVADATPHDMFSHNGAAMIGNGVAWFDGHGLVSVNEVEPAH